MRRFQNQLDMVAGVATTARHAVMWAISPVMPAIYVNQHYQPAKGKVVIYCVHGTADQHSAFSLVASRLINELPDIVAEIRLIRFEGRAQGKSIHYFASQLKNQIKQNQDENIILFGHSRGGIVAAYFAEYLSRENNINVLGVIAVCSPFLGADLACLVSPVISDSIFEMRPGSDLLVRLASKMEHSSIPYHYFSASNDLIVPAHNCVISAHAHHMIELDNHDHLNILSSHRLVEQIKNYIYIDIAPLLTTQRNLTINN